jgi:hypothetical protein
MLASLVAAIHRNREPILHCAVFLKLAAGRLAEKGYAPPAILQPADKEWNEDIQAKHGRTAIPAGEHPQLLFRAAEEMVMR